MTFKYDFSGLTVDKIKEITNQIIESEKNLTEELLKLDDSELSWNTYIKPGIDLDKINNGLSIYLNMGSFHPNEDVRITCSECENEINNFAIEQSMRRDIFNQFKKYYEKINEDKEVNMNEERKRYLENAMKRYKLSGLDLDDEKYEKVKEIKKEISSLGNKFDLNMNNENTTMFLTKNDLIGMPENYLSKRIQEDGTYKITLKYPDYVPLMEYCENSEVREKIYRAFMNRCYPENMEICIKIFSLRKKLANLLGYEKYSDMVLVDRMAKNTQNVMDFINDLIDKIKPLSLRDLNLLKEIKGSEIQPHDVSYYSTIYKKQKCDINEEDLRQYFPLNVVTKGMFEIYEKLLSYKIINVTDQYKGKFWHDDVELYQVNDLLNDKIKGYFALDLFPRTGKYGHAAVFSFVYGSLDTLPFSVMACNFEKDTGLSFGEVETYFHEFGHLMHDISSETELTYFSGTKCERDFVEAPSQMLEEWCYQSKSLKMMSINITDELIKKLNEKAKLLQGYHYGRQLSFALYDMILHSEKIDDILLKDENCGSSLRKLFEDISLQIYGLKPFENTNFVSTFGHIIHGYGAGYYGYLWSLVFAKDMFFSKFHNNELDPEIGISYRKEILSYGGSRDSMESLKIFLGREPSNYHFIDSLK